MNIKCRNTAVCIFVLVLIFISKSTAQEVSITFDGQGKLYTLNTEQNKKVKLYSGPGEFKSAQLFSINDTTFSLEIFFTKDGLVFRDRKILNKPELLQLQHHIENELLTNVKTEINQDGRGWLLTATTYSGITYYGIALPTALDLTDRSFLGVYLLTACSGFFVPYFLTKDQSVTYGQANLVYYGLSRGFFHGMMLTAAVTGNPQLNSMMGVSFFTGIGEAFLGFNAVNKYNISDGTANLMGVYGDFGILGGFAIANQINLFDTERGLPSTLLAASITGIAAGYLIGKNCSITAGDGEIIKTSAYLGAYLPLGLLLELDPNNSKVYSTTCFLTGAAGAYIGHLLVKNRDFQFMQAAIVELGTIAGGLGGAGLGYIINNKSASWVVTAGAIGAISAFIPMYNYYGKNSSSTSKSNFSLNFYPQNYFVLKHNNLPAQHLSNFPLVSFSKHF